MNEDILKLSLFESFDHIVQSAHGDRIFKNFSLSETYKRIIVIGAGKASAAMAASLERHLNQPLEGLVITRYGQRVPTKHIKVTEAAHPVPDQKGREAVDEILTILATAGPDDLIICLLSGGGSALMSAPVEGVSFENLQSINQNLLKSGASINEINCVRKHLNKVLGGKLANAAPSTKLITLAISDVVGDDPSTIASGPTVDDPTTLSEARNILKKYTIQPTEDIKAALENPANETPKKGDLVFTNNEYILLVTPSKSLNHVAEFWKTKEFHPIILDAEMEGDTNLAAKHHVEFIQSILKAEENNPLPIAVISGGETTVKIKGEGRGGPNTQFMLQSAISLLGNKQVYGMSCDTDGIDGSGDNAGAFITPDTLKIASDLSLDANTFLAENNSYAFFKATNQLVMKGPTNTNINDYRVFLLIP